MDNTNNSSLIELHVSDFELVKDFYGKLGFEAVWEREPDEKKGYLVMKKNSNVLCFWPGNEKLTEQPYFKRFPSTTKRGYGVEIVLIVDNIEDLYQKAKSFANIVEPLITQPWGLKDFRIEDPFGYYLRLTEPHNILDPKFAVK